MSDVVLGPFSLLGCAEPKPFVQHCLLAVSSCLRDAHGDGQGENREQVKNPNKPGVLGKSGLLYLCLSKQPHSSLSI